MILTLPRNLVATTRELGEIPRINKFILQSDDLSREKQGGQENPAGTGGRRFSVFGKSSLQKY
jgi:hypothetical protein